MCSRAMPWQSVALGKVMFGARGPGFGPQLCHLVTCVILGKIFNLPAPQFSYLGNGLIIVPALLVCCEH